MTKKSIRRNSRVQLILVKVFRVIMGVAITAALYIMTLVLGKTLWDLLELLIVPVVLSIGAYWFNQEERKAERRSAAKHTKIEREIVDKRLHEKTLQTYLDKMTDLMLEWKLRDPNSNEEIRYMARARTLAALRNLDGKRKGILLQFLHDAKLIDDGEVRVNIDGADLNNAELFRANLSGADLSKVILREANLSWANLRKTNLGGFDMDGPDLSGADLSGANLGKAKVADKRLEKARSLYRATMPDENRYDGVSI